MAALRAALLGAAVACAGGARAEPVLAGDLAHARGLWRLHCAGCHGSGGQPTPPGQSLGAHPLRDPALLAQRTDDQLVAAMLKGGPGPGSPALGETLSALDAGDLVALLRAGELAVADAFPDAAAYAWKHIELTQAALQRAATLTGAELEGADRAVTLFSVYGGERPPLGPRVVPDDPVQLDDLSPAAKKGYLVFGSLGGKDVALALAPDFTVARLLGPGLSAVSPAVLGKGSREPGKRRAFASKSAPDTAQFLTRLYARAVEAAAVAAKEEADRHLFDAPEKGVATHRSP